MSRVKCLVGRPTPSIASLAPCRVTYVGSEWYDDDIIDATRYDAMRYDAMRCVDAHGCASCARFGLPLPQGHGIPTVRAGVSRVCAIQRNARPCPWGERRGEREPRPVTYPGESLALLRGDGNGMQTERVRPAMAPCSAAVLCCAVGVSLRALLGARCSVACLRKKECVATAAFDARRSACACICVRLRLCNPSYAHLTQLSIYLPFPAY